MSLDSVVDRLRCDVSPHHPDVSSGNLDNDGVKQGHEQGDSGDGSELLGWPGNPEVVKDGQRTYPSTYLGCSRAVTVTLLTPGYQFWASPLKTSSSDQAASPGCALLYTPH